MQPPFVTALTTDAFELGLAVVMEGVAARPAPRRGGHGRARDDCSDCVTGLGHSLPKRDVRTTSALPLIATEEWTCRDALNVPKEPKLALWSTHPSEPVSRCCIQAPIQPVGDRLDRQREVADLAVSLCTLGPREHSGRHRPRIP